MTKKILIPLFILGIINPVYSFGGREQNTGLVKIELIKGSDKVHPDSRLMVAVKVKIEKGWHINSDKPNEDFLIGTKISSLNGKFPLAKTVFPKGKEISLGFSDKPVSVFQDEIVIGLLVNIDAALPAGNYKIELELSYQACNDQTCMPPAAVKDTLEINVVDKDTQINFINQGLFNNLDLSQGPIAQPKKESSIAATLESSGLLFSLLFVFIGGLALNLTPCVYPLIPITIGYFGGQSEGSTGKLFILGILYVLGMALTYSIIGVITSLSGAVFGTLLQNTFVIIGIALLFVLLSFSQFGLYEFKLPDSFVAKAGGAKTGAFGAFFMGLTMGIVAAPCIGPFVLGLVTYVAAKGSPLYGFLMFFFLALGLGFPYLILALFSGKIKKLPRAGAWMEGVKHIFGFLLLGMAIYFIGPVLPKVIERFLLPLFGIIAAFYLLLFDKMANNVNAFRTIKTVFSLLVIAASVYALIPEKNISPDWQSFSEAKYANSLKANEKMLVDFYADWCIPCKELDAMTFSDPRVAAESKKFSAYKVDMTQTLSDETEALRNKFRIVGMPTILIINSKGEEIERITGFMNSDHLLKAMSAAD